MLEWSIGELNRELGGRLSLGTMPPLGGDATPVGRIVTDSRRVEPGDVFWGLVGPRHNGADFADEAFARGASGAVAARRVEPWAGRWSLMVEDAQTALWQLAMAVRRRFDGDVVAVTGSVGKTTTREMIHAVIGSRRSGTASPHNYNNHIGVPLSMLAWKEPDDYAVLELGASRLGEIDALARLCAPHIGVITCVGEAHLASFGSQEAIAQAKTELLAVLPDDGWAVLGDDPWLRRMTAHVPARILWVGRSADCDVVATKVQSRGGNLSFAVEGHPFSVPVWGRHYLTSALASIAVGKIMKLSLEQIAGALARFEPPAQRCQVVRFHGVTIINDTYNASPTSMHAALELLRDFEATGRRMVVCGDMRELGETAAAWHRQLGDQVVSVCGADLLVACGDHAEDVVSGARDAGMASSRAIACRSPQEVLPVLSREVERGDVLLVKGSRALALEQIVEALQSGLATAAA